MLLISHFNKYFERMKIMCFGFTYLSKYMHIPFAVTMNRIVTKS